MSDDNITNSIGTEIKVAGFNPMMPDNLDLAPAAPAAVVQPEPVVQPELEVPAYVPADEPATTEEAPEVDTDAPLEIEFDDVSPDVETRRPVFTQEKEENFKEIPSESYMEGAYELMYAYKDAKGIPVDQQEMTDKMGRFAPQMIGHNALRRPGSKWQSSIKYGEYTIGMGGTKLPSPSMNVKGKQALLMLRRVSNLGTNVRLVLPRSCVYLEITTPSDTAMIQFDYKIMTERSRIGMATRGLLLAANAGAFTKDLVELALEHVVNTNIANLGSDRIVSMMERIDPLDYGLIINALMAAKYPNGYPWFLTCVNPTCNHKEPTLMHFGRTDRIDFAALNEKQLKMLSTKYRSITDAELQEYRDEFKLSDKAKFKFNDNVTIYLRTGTLKDYVDSSLALKEVIEAAQVNAITNYATEAQREAYMATQIQARAMRNYAHFVSKIVMTVGDEEVTIDDRETIVDALEDLSVDTEATAEFDAHVTSWIEENTISIVGYPTYECPMCKHEIKTKSGLRFRNFMPIAIDRIFFTVTRLKSLKLAEANTTQ